MPKVSDREKNNGVFRVSGTAAVKITGLENIDWVTASIRPYAQRYIKSIEIVDDFVGVSDDEDNQTQAEAQEDTDVLDAEKARSGGGNQVDAWSIMSTGLTNIVGPPNPLDKNTIDPEMTRYCVPIVRVLDGIRKYGGSLSSFTWTVETGWGGEDGIRPPWFWAALWAHSFNIAKAKSRLLLP
jgi:hypothetical protein